MIRRLITSALALAAVAVVSPDTAGAVTAGVVAITPCRILDTREAGEGPALVGQTTRAVTVRGLCGIPPGATAITYNATIAEPAARGFLTLHPSDEALPLASSLNFAAGEVRGNAGLAKLGAAEPSLSAYLATAPSGQTAHLILDVTGYHAGTLAGLAARASGQDFTANRWIEHGDGTATDRLTGLQWELKTDDGSIHDKDDTYTWSTGAPWNPDGTAFTVFLDDLNTPPCFAGLCDWRLPAIDELQSISEPGYPNCSAPPCTTIPGETFPSFYWSSTVYAGATNNVWIVYFLNGFVGGSVKDFGNYARAVRGGP